MKTIKGVASIIIVALLAAACGFLLAFGRTTQTSSESFVPFTAHLVEKHYATLNALQPAATNEISVGRRRDGSEVEIISVHSPNKGQIGSLVYILDVASSREIQLEPFTKSIMTFYLSPSELAARLSSKRCSGNVAQSTDRSKMMNYDVVISKNEYRKGTADKWLAPYLSCFTLKEVYSSADGAWNEKIADSLTEGEPQASMFEIPSDYIERSPSQIADAWTVVFPGSMWMSEKAATSYDGNYFRHMRP
ncbi:MAG: hypothetical protein ACRD59_15295 [Candidatus Acidiferrales bacterium]